MKKNIVRISAMLLVMAMMLCACGSKDQSFSNNGLYMELPGSYRALSENEMVGFTFGMGDKKSVVLGLKEEKSMFESYGLDLTLEEYADLVIEANSLSTTVKYEGGIPTFTFSKYIDGTYYKYLAATIEGADAFWLIQFACEEGKFDDMYNTFIKYLTTVKA